MPVPGEYPTGGGGDDDAPPRRRLSPEQRRAEILAAARRAFATRPYAAVTIGDIAHEAGASRALVTHYFGDKASLFIEVVTAFALQAAQTVAVGTSLPRRQMVEANVDAVLGFVADHRETVLALLPGSAAQEPRVGERVDQMRDAIASRMIANQFPDGDAPPTARFALRSYTGMFAVAVGDWLRRGEPSREEVAGHLSRMLLALIDDLRRA